MTYLDDWAALEGDHVDALSGAVEDLEANTLRLPLTGGAKVCMFFWCFLVCYLGSDTSINHSLFTFLQADFEHLKVAICSAVDVMQAMGSAIRPLLSRVS
jgi:hypothetical protein